MNNEETLAAVGQGQSRAPSLILLKEGSHSPPIFRAHGWAGSVAGLLPLAGQLQQLLKCAGFCALVFLGATGVSPKSEAHSYVQASKTSAAPAPQKPELQCPDGSAHPSSTPGHHKVVLSWNASTPSKGHDVKGYCVYRSETAITATSLKQCNNCQLINKVPVSATGCVDDLVQDDHTYYYVAAAIDAESNVSSFSNQANVTAKEPVQTGPPTSASLCRVTPN